MKVAHAAAAACAPIGAWFTVATLVTGSLWGKPMWGAYWVWDPRLTSELVLLFLYFGYMGLRAAIEDPQKADKASAVLAIVGVVNVPDHQILGELVEFAAPAAPRDCWARPTWTGRMVWPLLLMFLAFIAVLRRRAADPAARRAAAARAQRELGSRGAVMSEFFAMSGYGKYICGRRSRSASASSCSTWCWRCARWPTPNYRRSRRLEMSAMMARHKRMIVVAAIVAGVGARGVPRACRPFAPT